MKELFNKLLEDLDKYKGYLIIYLVLMVMAGSLWGLLREREIDLYKQWERENTSNIKDIYRDEYTGYNLNTMDENFNEEEKQEEDENIDDE